MAPSPKTPCLCFTTFTPPSSSSLVLIHQHQPPFLASPKRFVSPITLEPSSSATPLRKPWAVVAEGIGPRMNATTRHKLGRRPCEVYVCNLPRSCNAAHLIEMFNPHGPILSVEVCRNAETGESRGCGYVTMASMNSARNAVAALDGTDVGGREMLVRFSVEMNHGRRDPENMISLPKKVIYYEAPHKLYVGNLNVAVRPEQLRNLFSRFGNVVSARVLHDHKQGKNRVYAFLSFLSDAERDAAMTLNGTEFYGRTLIVKEGVERTKP